MTFVNSIAESAATVDESTIFERSFEPFQGAPRTSESVAFIPIADDEITELQTGPETPPAQSRRSRSLTWPLKPRCLKSAMPILRRIEEPASRTPLRGSGEASEMFAGASQEMSAEHEAGVEARHQERSSSKPSRQGRISQYYKHSGGSNSGTERSPDRYRPKEFRHANSSRELHCQTIRSQILFEVFSVLAIAFLLLGAVMVNAWSLGLPKIPPPRP